MIKLFAVTIVYNTALETINWLESMEKIKYADFQLEIVIIDNASKEPFVLPKKFQKSHIHFIRLEENTGFSGGNNIGMKYALDHGADYVLLINDDTLVDPNFLVSLVKPFQSNTRIGVTVPKIYFAKGHEFHKDRYKKDELGKVFWYAGGHTDWANITSVHRGVDEVDHGQYDQETRVTFASGCCMLIKKEVLEKVGLFDDRYFLYFEDADLSQRILNAGYTILFTPRAVIWHVNAASSGGSGNVLQDYFITRNRMLFGLQYAPIRSKIALLRESARLLLKGRPMQKKGIKDFYAGKFNKGTFFNKP